MIKIRKSAERGHAEHGWLRSFHTFSFANYYDPDFMGFRDLRVINEDYIAGGEGFPTHPHRDMEILTYVTSGALEHKDTLGTSSVIRPGEMQRMSAGTGVQHSEFNHFPNQETSLLQIWILPNRQGHKPGYEQKNFAESFAKNPLTLVASKDGRDGSLHINQDVDLYVGKWNAARTLEKPWQETRYGWLQVVNGTLSLNGINLSRGDAAAFGGEKNLSIKASNATEFLLFDLN